MANEEKFIEFHILDASHTPKRDRFGRFISIAVQFKNGGKWRVHKSDPDKVFPSDFHADRVDKPEKLNLYDGAVYSKTTKQHLYDMSAKQMRRIHQDLEHRGEEFLDDRLNQRNRFSYLK